MQANHPAQVRRLSLVLVSALAAACGGGGGDAGQLQTSTAQSCMLCHNGSLTNDYAGPGIENPHPYAPANNLLCTTCHGGNGQGVDKVTSHVPPPPQIGDLQNLTNNATAYFNRLTLAGIDRYADYTVDGVTYSALDYLQFINPGDLRVVSQNRACGQCHDGHAEGMWMSPLATEMGILGGAMYAAGVDNEVPANAGVHMDTAADTAFRAVTDPDFNAGTASPGAVGELIQFPVFSVRNQTGGDNIFQNQAYTAALLNDDRNADNSVVTGSHLANLLHEQIAFTCGDCHLGSAGANNRYGDFRSSGCTACHMRYSLDGRSGSGDPNVNALEPLDPDDIDAPERSHISRHLVRSIAKTLPGGEQVQGIDDYACAGCHQGSNRTVMQYWGIRLDQNEDVHRGRQYPANPDSFVDTGDDPRLFDPVVGNNTFNGRRDRQYLLFEDYDGDGRDDTPADVHYDAGLGCIDCHGSYDLHGAPALGQDGEIASRMEQAVAIRCESCHGSADAYAATAAGTNYSGAPATLAMDSKGNPLKHVQREADGNHYLYSRLTGQRHFVKQTRDVVVDSGKLHPFTGQPVYSELGSYAMGRDDGMASTGIGPQQGDGSVHSGFSHADNVSCAACHASWANSCIGCHLKGEYDNGNNFSNITGQRIVYKQANADFVYQTPVPFQLGIGPDNKIVTISPNTEMFYQYQDINGAFTDVFAFSNRNGGGNNATPPELPALSHNVLMPHSIRGKVSQQDEGPRYCVACHLTTEGMTNFGAEYATLRTAMTSGNFQGLDFDFFNDVLKQHIGLNPGNSLNSPLWVHMVAGLGTGLFLFDQDGCPENPLDNDPNRIGCNGAAPATHFNLANAAFNLDRIVAEDGTSNASNNHAMLDPGQGPNLRDGPSSDPDYSGPLGMTLIQRLADPNAGIVLDAWIDADGQPGGGLQAILQQNP